MEITFTLDPFSMEMDQLTWSSKAQDFPHRSVIEIEVLYFDIFS